MIRRLREILKKELIQVLRDKRMRFVLVVPPMIQLLVFGYAVNFDIHHIPTAIYDLDQTAVSRELLAQFSSSRYFDIRYRVERKEEIINLIDRGVVTLALQINPGFAADLTAGRTAQLQIIVDGTDSNTASVAMGYINHLLANASLQLLRERINRLGPSGEYPLPAVGIEERAWYNPNLESRPFFVPGIIATLVLIITMTLTAMAIVREREIGTLEQLMVTPLKPIELILGKTIPFALIGMMDVVLITLLGVFWFGISIAGNPLILLLGAILFLLSSLGMGLLLSTLSGTQQQAMVTSFFIIMPSILLSGFAFPIANMPEPIQYLTYLNPLRYFLVVIRGVFLKGNGLDILWPQLLAMALLGSLMITLSALRFKKRIE